MTSVHATPQVTFQFVSIENLIEQRIGFNVFTHICAEANIEANVTPLPAKRAEYSVAQGVSDGEILRIREYGHNNPNVIRIPTAYYQLQTTVFSRRSAPVTLNTIEELRQYKVGIVRGVKHTDIITRDLPSRIQTNDTEQLFNLLELGRIDIAITSKVNGLNILKQLGNQTITHQPQHLDTKPLYIYVNRKNAPLADQLNRAILTLKQAGRLQSIIHESEQLIIGTNR